jgi:hypothetical protein
VQPIVPARPAAKVTLDRGSNGMVVMRYANGKQRLRAGLWTAAGVGLIAGPAFAFGGFGVGFSGFHGSFHGGMHGGVGHAPIRPAIDAPTPRPPFTNPPPAMHFAGGDRHDHFHAHFHNHFHNGWGWGWGGWGLGGWGGDDVGYQAAEAQPAYGAPAPPRQAEPPPCAELLTWSPKLGRATRQRLCETD